MAQFLNMYSVDLQKPTGPQPLRQMVCAGDNAANRIGAIVTSDGGTVSLGGSCVGKVVRADGTTVQLSGTISGNQAYVVLDQASCAIVGQIQVAVCWVSGSSVTTLVIAYGSVVSTQTGSPVQPSTPIPDLTQLLAEIENMRTATAAATAAATGALANFAGAFDETAVYTAGQYVTYTDGKFYRLTADHAANVTWANTSKVAVTTGGEFIGLKQAIATDKANIMANFAGAFVQATAYPAGTYVTYTDGNMYILPNGHEANATWANTTKTQVSVGGELSELKSAIKVNLVDNHNGIQTFYGYGNFQHYGLNTDGTFMLTQKYRVSNDDPMTFDRDLKISVKSGFRWGYIPFTGTTPGSWSGWNTSDFTIPHGTSFVVQIARATEITTEIADVNEFLSAVTFEMPLSVRTSELENRVDVLEFKTQNITIPELRNGSAGNVANANSVSTLYIYPIDFTKDSFHIEYTGDASLANEYYWAYCKFSGATDGMTSQAAYDDSQITKATYNATQRDFVTSEPFYDLPTANLVGYDHIMFFLFRKLNGTFVPLRIATDQYSFRMTYKAMDSVQSFRDIDSAETKHDILYAKHAKGNTGTRLTLVHFSDLHKDTTALARIMKDTENFTYDDAICTGDMVADTYEQIASWWNASVLTCIGNHDSASYSSQTGYNWTALSMANRSAYYIDPFESGWGITHSSGTSYYYKDYADAKVRLIVMDAMLYVSGGSEATAQTSWLEGLLASAITNNLHVVIAIHAPHGGAEAKECSFSKYGQTTMPTYSDCNTPQSIIDAVATKISSGLKFIGYLVGHTHQDNIWDAEGNGAQLMYCITCASVSNANQWKGSDQHRDTENDAYNIITVDTANTLVKIIRGGGANMDDHMRTRKAICFDYSTGTKVGEVT